MRISQFWTVLLCCCILLASGCGGHQRYMDGFDADTGLWNFPSPGLELGVGAEIADGKLIVRIEPPYRMAWADLTHEYTDFDVTVEATPGRDEQDDTYGILFRYVNGLKFYAFMVSVGGYYAVFRVENDVRIRLSDWHRSPAIMTGMTTNTLRVVGRDGRFAFYVNGTQVPLCPGGIWLKPDEDLCDGAELTTVLEEHTFYSGRLALAAGCGHNPGAEVNFDNFKVR